MIEVQFCYDFYNCALLVYMTCSTVKCTSTNVTLGKFSNFPYFLPKYRNNINQGYNYCFTYIHIAQTVWISQSNKFLIAKLNHMNLLSNQWPQKSRLLPLVNKNDFCCLFSVKIDFFKLELTKGKVYL